jgi:hypothetical protein
VKIGDSVGHLISSLHRPNSTHSSTRTQAMQLTFRTLDGAPLSTATCAVALYRVNDEPHLPGRDTDHDNIDLQPDSNGTPKLAVMPLDSASLVDLFGHLLDSFEEATCDKTFRFTDQWAHETGVDAIALLNDLERMDQCCDCEVMLNVCLNADIDLDEEVEA